MFSSRSLLVSGLSFKSLIHFELTFVYGVRQGSSLIILPVAVQFSQQFLKKIFFPVVYSCLFCHKFIDHICVSLFLGARFCFIALFSVYIFVLHLFILQNSPQHDKVLIFFLLASHEFLSIKLYTFSFNIYVLFNFLTLLNLLKLPSQF